VTDDARPSIATGGAVVDVLAQIWVVVVFGAEIKLGPAKTR
jgi:hypothetical protein